MGPVLASASNVSDAVAQTANPALLPASASATIRLAFSAAESSEQAQQFTRQLAHEHYENFSVVSILLPRHLRQDFCNVYAFCRVADDLGDELPDREISVRCLADFRSQTVDLYAGVTRSIVFQALAVTTQRHDIPIEPFLNLIDAFQQDQRVDRYDTFEQVHDYCRRSADPVGRLVLYMSGYRDELRQRLSDQTCTALQLANFWQDVRRDILDRDRIYLPRESMERFGVTEAQLRDGRFDENYRALLQFEVERTERMFDEGDKLLPMLDSSVRAQVTLFGKGGRAILAAIRRQNFDTLTSRPALTKWDKGRIVLGALLGSIGQAISGSGKGEQA